VLGDNVADDRSKPARDRGGDRLSEGGKGRGEIHKDQLA
jgi:hypothetical protein